MTEAERSYINSELCILLTALEETGNDTDIFHALDAITAYVNPDDIPPQNAISGA